MDLVGGDVIGEPALEAGDRCGQRQVEEIRHPSSCQWREFDPWRKSAISSPFAYQAPLARCTAATSPALAAKSRSRAAGAIVRRRRRPGRSGGSHRRCRPGCAAGGRRRLTGPAGHGRRSMGPPTARASPPGMLPGWRTNRGEGVMRVRAGTIHTTFLDEDVSAGRGAQPGHDKPTTLAPSCRR